MEFDLVARVDEQVGEELLVEEWRLGLLELRRDALDEGVRLPNKTGRVMRGREEVEEHAQQGGGAQDERPACSKLRCASSNGPASLSSPLSLVTHELSGIDSCESLCFAISCRLRGRGEGER